MNWEQALGGPRAEPERVAADLMGVPTAPPTGAHHVENIDPHLLAWQQCVAAARAVQAALPSWPDVNAPLTPEQLHLIQAKINAEQDWLRANMSADALRAR